MKLPENLQKAIEEEVKKSRTGVLAKARVDLSQSYKENPSALHMQTDAERLSYLASRMPATYAAIVKVLFEFHRLKPLSRIESLLDLGSGPGTVLWAVSEVFGRLKQATLVERDPGLIELGKKLAAAGGLKADWSVNILTSSHPQFHKHDLAVFSYSYGELPKEKRLQLLGSVWDSVDHLAVIEPGTPRGYETILEVRTELIQKGGKIVAPCPQNKPCPMQGKDWCHFSVRLDRSVLHQNVKEAYRGFEDEKFSYVIFSKTDTLLPENRIVRHPMKHSGHVNFSLCTKEGTLANATVSKKHGELYKKARDAEWGDPWPI